MKRVGILGGTFDPPHAGHLRLAEVALGDLGLDEVLLVPAALPPHKGAPVVPGARRLELLREALAAWTLPVRVDAVELDRGGTSWTVDTLEALRAREPGSAFILLMGSDQASGFPAWRGPERILALASLAVTPRPGFEAPLPPLLAARLRTRWSGDPGEVVRIGGTGLELASRELRAELARGRTPAGIPRQVVAAIGRENLYR